MVIGMTGPSGSGKSEVGRLFAQKGFIHIDCDGVVHELGKTKTYADAVCSAFGDLRAPDGSLDRGRLGEIVFADPKALDRLNALVLPLISEEIEKRILSAGKNVLLDAPTLLEAGLDKRCDTVIAVIADRKTRLVRIMARDALTKEKAELRLDAQKPDSFYRERCPFIIENNGDLAALSPQVDFILKQIGVISE